MNSIEQMEAAMKQRKTLLDALGIEITKLSKETVCGKMPVDHRTHQIYGMLHGGASVAFAETLCSIAAHFHIDTEKKMAVGLEINANHLKSIRTGYVLGEAKPIHIGKKTQVWQIEIRAEDSKDLISISRCTMAVIDK